MAGDRRPPGKQAEDSTLAVRSRLRVAVAAGVPPLCGTRLVPHRTSKTCTESLNALPPSARGCTFGCGRASKGASLRRRLADHRLVRHPGLLRPERDEEQLQLAQLGVAVGRLLAGGQDHVEPLPFSRLKRDAVADAV